jgi:hypothetical protein
MPSLLQALIANESGGRNIPNTTQGTSSGQAQGYFQITTGTWDEFGGRKYARTPLEATPEQQADIASKIPLRRWDESTVARMRATGRPIDRNKTLGENLAMNGETFTGFARDAGGVLDKMSNKGVSLNSTPIGNVVPGTGAYTENVNAQANESGPGVYGNPASLTVANTGAYPPAPAAAATTAQAAPATFGDQVKSILGGDALKSVAKSVAPREGGADQLLPSGLSASMSADAGRAQAAATLMSTIIANRKKYGTTLNTPGMDMPPLTGFMG